MGLFDFVEDAVSSVGDFVSKAKDTVSDALDNVGIDTETVIRGVISYYTGGLGGLAANLGSDYLLNQGIAQGGIGRTGGGAVNISIDLGSLITEIPEALIRAVEGIADDMEQRVAVNISETAAEAITTQQEASSAIFADAFRTQTAAIVATQEAEQRLVNQLFDFVAQSALELDILGTESALNIGRLTESLTDSLERLLSATTAGLSDVLFRVIRTQETIEEESRELIRAQADGAESIAGEVGELAEGVAQEAKRNRAALMEALETYVGHPLGTVGDQVWKVASGLLSSAVDEDDGKIERTIKTAALGDLCGRGLTDNLVSLTEEFLPNNPLLRWVAGLVISVFTWLSIFGGITSAQAQTVLQAYGERCAYKVLSPPDAILAHFRGQIDRDEMLRTIQKDGFSRADAQNMWISSLQIPNELDLTGLWLRDIVQEEEFDDAMRHRGWDENWIGKLKQGARLLPPIQDLISMAVREAFTPEAVVEFGLHEDFPPDFAFWAEKQGVSREWALNYWAAHWGLPSIQMGYEMLHRGVIDERQLKALMKALDIVPAWRDNLIEISFASYTRVDIRRMHKLGILSEEEVTRAYLDLGYNQERAENLTRFTVELNRPPPTRDIKTLEDLTRSNIMGFYMDGIIDRREATNLMRRAGFEDNVIDLFIDGADLEIERAERKADTDLVVERAKAGVISFDDAQDDLNRLGLSTLERTKALNTLVRAQAARTKLPSKADLGNFRKAGILNDPQYLDGMERLGYSELWAGRYLQLVKGAAQSG